MPRHFNLAANLRPFHSGQAVLVGSSTLTKTLGAESLLSAVSGSLAKTDQRRRLGRWANLVIAFRTAATRYDFAHGHVF